MRRNNYAWVQLFHTPPTLSCIIPARQDLKTIPGSATMAYYLKPLTYNSQVAGYLIRSYPGPWTVLDGTTKDVLGTYDDDEILVEGTNTPDLRGSGRLVQRSVDERAIRARSSSKGRI